MSFWGNAPETFDDFRETLSDDRFPTSFDREAPMTTCSKGKSPRRPTQLIESRRMNDRDGNRLVDEESSRLLRLKEVLKRTGLGKTKMYELQAQGKFPMRVRITDSGSMVGWDAAEIETWIRQRKNRRQIDSRGRGVAICSDSNP